SSLALVFSYLVGGVVDGVAVFFYDVEVAVFGGGVGGAFVDDLGGAVGEGAVDDVGVAGDPADVGGAPVDVVAGFVVEDVVVGVGGLGEVAAAGVQDAFGFSNRKSTRLISSHVKISYAVV